MKLSSCIALSFVTREPLISLRVCRAGLHSCYLSTQTELILFCPMRAFTAQSDSARWLTSTESGLRKLVSNEFITRERPGKVSEARAVERLQMSYTQYTPPTRLNCVYVVTQFTILQPICDWRRKLKTGSRLTTGAFTPPTRLYSTVELRRRRRCVLGRFANI